MGVAKKANLIAVKVLNAAGSGPYSDVIAGIDWAVAQAQATGNPSVINMSLGGPLFTSIDLAINRAVAAGVPVMYVCRR